MPECHHESSGLPTQHFASVDAFAAAADLSAGVKVIGLPDGNHVDVAFNRDLHGVTTLPVFFNGALNGREGTHPPYLSGLGIGSRLDLPVAAIADPIFNQSGDLVLGWYAGIAGRAVQEHVLRILEVLGERFERLLLVGGSGGGFASLLFAEKLGEKASVYAWNPQTDFLRYSPPTVRAYLAAALEEDRWLDPAQYSEEEARTLLNAGGIESLLPGLGRCGEALILQNASDWHVPVHFLPFTERSRATAHPDGSLTSDSGRHVFVQADLGDGHAAPSVESTEYVIKRAVAGAPLAQVHRELLTMGLMALPAEPSAEDDNSSAPSTSTDYMFRGTNLTLHGIQGDAIFEHVATRHEPYERILIDELCDLLAPEDLVLDVGANIGNHALAWAASTGCRVVAFEALDSTFTLLRRNIVTNDLNKRITPLPLAVGARAGRAQVAGQTEGNLGATRFAEASDGVEMVCLDDLALPTVRLIKVDVEGMDVDVLRGARALIERDRPLIVCEASTRQELDELDEMAAEIGYAYVGKFNATPTFLLMPSRPGVEALRVNRRLVERLTTTNLLARDLVWRTKVLDSRLDSMAH